MILNASNLNTLKQLGRKTKLSDILDIFTKIENQQFGVRDTDNNFMFRDDILDFVQSSDLAKEFLIKQGLSVAMLVSGLVKMPIIPACRKRKLQEIEKENNIPIKNVTLTEVVNNL